MMFRDLAIKRTYRTKLDYISDDFVIPVLRCSKRYDRCAGFFTLNGLISLAKGIIPFFRNGGILRVITSVELSESDLNVIKNAYDLKSHIIEKALIREIDKEINSPDGEFDLDLITNLIASSMIQIKIGSMKEGGLYHEKTALFEDLEGNKIWYNGSLNETNNAYHQNREAITVLKSWNAEDAESIIAEEDYFNSLWNGLDDEVDTFDFPEAAKKNLFVKYKKSDSVEEAIEKQQKQNIVEKKHKNLYPYQSTAVDEFLHNNGCHFYQMATGTGKTFTAIRTIKALKDRVKAGLYVVIVVPQIDLQAQWKIELEDEDIRPYLFGGIARNDLDDEFNSSIIDYMNDELVVSVCVSDTFFAKLVQKINQRSIPEIMFIVDEAHTLSKNQLSLLPNKYKYRLGLSATPERYDAAETKKIMSYFTKDSIAPFVYTIDEAIANGFLSKYKYYFIEVQMTEDEFKEYKVLSKRIATLQNKDIVDEKALQDAKNVRSLIVKKASNKIEILRSMLLSGDYNFINSVIYCGLGKDENDNLIIDQVTSLLNEIGHYSVSQFTSKTIDRPRVLQEFQNGYYDILAAIQCFDQGVDVPKLDKIYIMSSDASLRQTIQRRGRVLRQCKETGKTMAYIYDFVCVPPPGEEGGATLVANELRRIKEYARLADNFESECRFKIDKLISDYDVEMEDCDEDE